MESMPRHQCVIYSGLPSDLLTGLANVLQVRLRANYRCLYLNSPPMVTRMRSSLSAQGMNVDREIAEGRLLLVSDRGQLVDGAFDTRRMLELLRGAVASALADGRSGLWASGDMAWEFGPRQDFSSLVEYERALEVLVSSEPALCGICQYHADTLPDEVVRQGYSVHRALFVNETLTRINPQFVPARNGHAN